MVKKSKNLKKSLFFKNFNFSKKKLVSKEKKNLLFISILRKKSKKIENYQKIIYFF